MIKLKNVFLLSIFLSLSICISLLWAAGENKEVKPGDYAGCNVIFISFDALQASHTGCLGYFRKTTPTIDRFAREGFLFKHAISQASWTVPATMSYFTSLYPSQHK